MEEQRPQSKMYPGGWSNRSPGRKFVVQRTSEMVAQEIREMVLAGDIPIGVCWKTQEDLVAEMGVSRSSVREALRILEMQGLLELKRGPRGGISIKEPRWEIVTNSTALLLRYQKTPVSELVQARRHLEVLCAQLAATRATPEQVDRLRETVVCMTSASVSNEEFSQANLTFHYTITLAAGNTVIGLVMDSLRDLLTRLTWGTLLYDEDRGEVIKAHRRILEGMERRDSALAGIAMDKHLKAHEEVLERQLGRRLTEVIIDDVMGVFR